MSFDSGADYTLEIDFYIFTVGGMKNALKILYNSSSLCYEDIDLLAENVIQRMDGVGFQLRDIEYIGLKDLAIDTFGILRKIHSNPNRMMYEFHEKFNRYMYGTIDDDSPVASPVRSPMIREVEEVRVPKIMKKAPRNH